MSEAITSRATLIRPALLACASVLVPLMIAGAIWEGVAGALGAGAGVLLVAIGFSSSWIFVAWSEQLGVRIVLPAGVMAYVAKIILVAAAFLWATKAEWAGTKPMAMATFVAIVVMLTVLMVWAARMRLPVLKPEDSL